MSAGATGQPATMTASARSRVAMHQPGVVLVAAVRLLAAPGPPCGRSARAGAPAGRGAWRRAGRRTRPRPAAPAPTTRPLRQQQVVAFGHHQGGIRRHGHGSGDGVLDLAAELRRPDHPRLPRAQAGQQGDVPRGVEGVGGTLATDGAALDEHRVGEVVGIHAHEHAALDLGDDALGQRRLARTRRPGQPQQGASWRRREGLGPQHGIVDRQRHHRADSTVRQRHGRPRRT